MKKLGLIVGLLLLASVGYADDGSGSILTDRSILYLAGIFGVSFAAIGGTKAQSQAASVALEGIARNPAATDKLFTPMLLALALMESLVIFTLVSIFLVK
jgi:F-type H+-transporting ATPase subunit c